jgi:tryptophan 2,3-dioxygenase
MTLPPATSYVEYQAVETLLELQHVRSDAPDEMTFLTIAQAMELMYKATHFEADVLRNHIAADRVEEAITSGERIRALIGLITESWNVYATITPVGYLQFRDALGTGSGFQSPSYRLLEFALGNRVAALADHHRNTPWAWTLIEAEYAKPSVWDETNRLLARRGYDIPASVVDCDWAEPYEPSTAVEHAWLAIYSAGTDTQLIRLGERLVDVAMQFSEFRAKHLLVVERTMGWRPGTGGTSGVGWLRTITEHRFFPELWSMRTAL